MADYPLIPVEAVEPFHLSNGVTGSLNHYCFKDIPSEHLIWVWDLMERNMKDMYEKSKDGWNFDDKKEEMSAKNSRYYIAFVEDTPVAFTHFQIDMDYGREVVYCYEIQLEEKVRSCGLGKHIMRTLEAVARKANLEYVVLTVFKHNPKARNFFKKIGYAIDSTNPARKEKKDYFILSRRIVEPGDGSGSE